MEHTTKFKLSKLKETAGGVRNIKGHVIGLLQRDFQTAFTFSINNTQVKLSGDVVSVIVDAPESFTEISGGAIKGILTS